MFKRFLVLAMLSFNTYALTEPLFFECMAPKVDGVHRFEAKGVVFVDDFNNIDGLITVKTLKSEENNSILIFEQVKVTGFLVYHPANDELSSSFEQLSLSTEIPYLKRINIILGAELPMVSNVLSIDNFMYRSNCTRVPGYFVR
jgi:hypothetical protein